MNDERTRRPNILFITSDQHRGDAFGFEGSQVRTPHLDRLAAGGTRFSACTTPNPVCQPARASLLTGLLPNTHGVWDNGVDLDPAVAAGGFAALLGHSGYHTAFIGKAHFSSFVTYEPTGRAECIASLGDWPEGWRGPYMGFEEVELTIPGHWGPRPPGGHYERWLHAGRDGSEILGLYQEDMGEPTGAPQQWRSALPVAWHSSSWVGDRTVAFLRERASRGGDEPFCLWASFPDPHHPFDAPDPWARMYDPASIELPKHRTRDLDRRPWWHRASLESEPGQGNDTVKNYRTQRSRATFDDDRQLAEVIANYYGMISLIDHNVGRMLDELSSLGLQDDTIVIFTSDHGEWLGDHGLLLKGPMLYEGLQRVALVASGPGVEPGQVITGPTSTLDLAPTFTELAGLAPGAIGTTEGGAHGHSLVPALAGEAAPLRTSTLTEWSIHPSRLGVSLALINAHTGTHKLTIEIESGAGELYDLVEDPHEMYNRFEDPALGDVRAELEELLRARPTDAMTELSDPVGMA